MIERRRKELLDKLSLLHGGTLKGKPTTDDEAHEKKDEKSEDSSSASSSTVTSPDMASKRNSIMVLNRIKDYETIHHSAKKEEEKETPKRFVTLKKVNKPDDFPDDDTDNKSPASGEESTGKKETESESVPANEKEQDKLEVVDTEGEMREASSISEIQEGDDERDKKESGKKKKSKLGFGQKMKGLIKREKSPAPERKNSAESSTVPDAADGDTDEAELAKQEEAEELEEGVRISGILERMKKKGQKKHKSIKVKVCETTMVLGEKEEVLLSNCSVELTDQGFDLSHPQHKSAFFFKVEGDETARQKWVTAMNDAIQKATPVVEEGEISSKY